MADITKCSSITCPIQKNCYRHEASISSMQSYCNYEYTCNEENGFCNFIKMERGD